MIPAVLESTANGFLVSRGGYRPSDLCVSAPTGSGKTLAFVIPVVQVSIRTPSPSSWACRQGVTLLTRAVVSSAGPATSSCVPGSCPGCAANQGAGPAGTWTPCLEVRSRVFVAAGGPQITLVMATPLPGEQSVQCLYGCHSSSSSPDHWAEVTG